MSPSPIWKPLIDYVGGLLILIVALLPMIAVGAAILVDSGWPVLLRQRRIGRYGHEYRMWKFRTLPKDTPEVAKAELGQAGMRPTMLGRFLRRHSIDELPQLMNVLAGDMSLVGPRPALYTQQDLTAMRATKGVLVAKPGLTGLAQVSGREDLSLMEKVSLDASYVRSMSLLNDARIVLRTISLLMRPRGSY